MLFIILLVAFVVNIDGGELESCTKDGIPGVCTNIRQCPDAQLDIKNRKQPQLCEFINLDPIVCCVSKKSDICHLPPHPSAEYNCIISGATGTRPCKELEPHGTVVSPSCRVPNYYSPTPFSFMHCINGSWDYVAKCNPECGTVTPEGALLLIEGKPDRRAEVPWHASIYTKSNQLYTHICGGSLVTSRLIISAAHCFWSFINGKQPESNYAVAVGKLYQAWDDPNDAKMAQHSDVKEIHLPARYQGVEASFQDDIALVVVSKMFELKIHIRPICVDFDYIFERRQLDPRNKGKIAGWGLTSTTGDAPRELKVAEVPYVSIATCISEWPASFKEYITSDKICAAQSVTDGLIAFSKGDSGGGLVFPASDRGKTRYYLRGVMDLVLSSCGADKEPCDTKTYIGFTHVSQHENFIKEIWEKNL